MSLMPGSSTPEMDVLLVLADGSDVLCESEKRVDWGREGGGYQIQAPWESVIPLEDLEQLRAARVTESGGAGRVGLE